MLVQRYINEQVKKLN